MNERYIMMRALDSAVKKGEQNGVLIIISPSEHGKTQTVDMFIRDVETAKKVYPISETRLEDYLRELMDNTTTLIFDDTNGWNSTDLNNALDILKNVADGKIESSRMTNFHSGIPSPCVINVMILINEKQYDDIRNKLDKSGLSQRATLITTYQSKETRAKVKKFYREHGYTSKNLPEFKIDLKFEKRDISKSKHLEWIDTQFPTGKKNDTVYNLLRYTTDETFENLKRFLMSGLKHPAPEQPEFIEPKVIKNGKL